MSGRQREQFSAAPRSQPLSACVLLSRAVLVARVRLRHSLGKPKGILVLGGRGCCLAQTPSVSLWWPLLTPSSRSFPVSGTLPKNWTQREDCVDKACISNCPTTQFYFILLILIEFYRGEREREGYVLISCLPCALQLGIEPTAYACDLWVYEMML